MKKLLLTAFVISASLCTVNAQDRAAVSSDVQAVKESDKKAADVAARAKEWQKKLVSELQLTDEQQKKIAAMDEAFGERRKAIENNADLTAEVKKEKFMALRKARHAEFTSLLTSEQQEKYKQIIEESKKGS